MADITKKVALELVLEGQRKVEEDLKKTTASLKDKGGVSNTLEKTTLRFQKQREKIDKKINDPRKKKQGVDTMKRAVKLEQQKLDLIRKQNQALDQQNRKLQRAAAMAGGGGRGGIPGGAAGGGGRGGGRFPFMRGMGGGGGMGRMAMVGGAGALAGFGIGALLGLGGMAVGATSRSIGSGYNQYMQYGNALTGLMGTGTSYGQAGYRSRLGAGLGFDQIETARQMRAAGIATGQTGAVTRAQMTARGTSLDAGQATNFMGLLTRAGSGFGGMAGQGGSRQLQNIIALGFKAGIDKARLPEYMKGVTQVVAAQGARQGRDVDATRYATMLRAMGAFGGSGMQGERGAAVFRQLNESIVRPGGGEAGQALMLQAMGFGRPGQNTSYYEARKRQEQGATPENVVRLFNEMRGQRGGGEAMRLAMQEMTGLGLTQIEELEKVVGSMAGPGRQKELERILRDAKPPEVQAVDQMKELGQTAFQTTKLTNRLVNIGEANREAIFKMQNAINKLVDILIPAATKLLSIIATAVAWTAEKIDQVARIFGAGAGEVKKEMEGQTVGEFLDNLGPAALLGGGKGVGMKLFADAFSKGQKKVEDDERSGAAARAQLSRSDKYGPSEDMSIFQEMVGQIAQIRESIDQQTASNADLHNALKELPAAGKAQPIKGPMSPPASFAK